MTQLCGDPTCESASCSEEAYQAWERRQAGAVRDAFGLPAIPTDDRPTMPERIQLRRTKGWRLPLNAKSVARPGPWGNPFRVGLNISVEQFAPPTGGADFLKQNRHGFGAAWLLTQRLAVELFRAWVEARPAQVEEIRAELAGFDLACWCKLDEPCHADVLLEIANGGES